MADVEFLQHNDRVLPVVHSGVPLGARPRGRVAGFSKYSRKRLTQIFYSYKNFPFKTFWTFTFETDVTAEFSKFEINRLNNVFRRRGIGFLWCMEFTKKNRIHYHYALTASPWKGELSRLWGNGFVAVRKIFGHVGLRKYFLKEISKMNQKNSSAFNGRWWGISRRLNKQFSYGVFDESFLAALVGNRGFKSQYWREDLKNIVDRRLRK